ncbi:glycosyltransferase family 4 protein [Parvibaculum sp.]|uniref:glycosyltransferase family 4 protein n=1 Tax=Parvibaculum sp. TaxID=2024848 RepID=UPI00391C2D7F
MTSEKKIKVVICYPLVNAYMAACWRELVANPRLDVFVVGFRTGPNDLVSFPADIMKGIPSRLLNEEERAERWMLAGMVADLRPDVLFVSGWSERSFRTLYFDRRLESVPKILVMDNQFRGDLRQRVGSIVLKPLLNRIEGIFVTGERSWQYARYLGMDEDRIHRGAVSVDYGALSDLYDARVVQFERWPRNFFFAGRYHPRKAIDILVDAYMQYRSCRSDPWTLTTAGMGPEAHLLSESEGVHDLGFVSPEGMRRCWLEAGAFILPSRFDAWPLVIVEAAAAGLPVIATEACGSTVEVVRDMYNGIVVPTGSVDALAQAMMWVHDNDDRLAIWGARSKLLAEPYAAAIWADRVEKIVSSLVQPKASAQS